MLVRFCLDFPQDLYWTIHPPSFIGWLRPRYELIRFCIKPKISWWTSIYFDHVLLVTVNNCKMWTRWMEGAFPMFKWMGWLGKFLMGFTSNQVLSSALVYFLGLIDLFSINSCSCISKPNHRRLITLRQELHQLPMAQQLPVFLLGLCLHHLKHHPHHHLKDPHPVLLVPILRGGRHHLVLLQWVA